MPNIQNNPDLHKKRLKIELLQMKTNMERMDLRLLELEDEKKAVEENKVATIKQIADLEAQIGG